MPQRDCSFGHRRSAQELNRIGICISATMTVLDLLHRPISRRYRLIDASLHPHPQLDGLYESLQAALEDAAAWCCQASPDHGLASIGVEVLTTTGSWRTVRHPG